MILEIFKPIEELENQLNKQDSDKNILINKRFYLFNLFRKNNKHWEWKYLYVKYL